MRLYNYRPSRSPGMKEGEQEERRQTHRWEEKRRSRRNGEILENDFMAAFLGTPRPLEEMLQAHME